MVVARLEGIAQGLIRDSLAASSQRAYHTAQKSFGSFCASLGILAVPASEHLLLLYAAHLSQHVCHGSLAGGPLCPVLFVSNTPFAPLSWFSGPPKAVWSIGAGIERSEAEETKDGRFTLPITPLTLSIIGQSLVRHFDPYDQLLV